jgi:hypothetical protein
MGAEAGVTDLSCVFRVRTVTIIIEAIQAVPATIVKQSREAHMIG